MSRTCSLAKLLPVAILCIAALQGCGDTTLLRLTNELSSKAGGSSRRVESFYDFLVKAHSDMRSEEVRIQTHASTPLDPAAPGPLSPVSDAQIKLRKQSARFLETYCLKLDSLVNAKTANELNSAVSDINKSYSLIDGIRNANLMSGFAAGATPITTGLKILSRRTFSYWSDKKVRAAIIESNTAFEAQAKSLEKETTADADATKTRAVELLGLEERIFSKLTANHASTKEIAECNESIARTNEMIRAITQSNPSETYTELIRSHRQLVDHVSSKPTIEKKP